MKYRIFSSLLLLCPLLAWGDTIVMKDGTRYNGTFVSGSSRSITFVDDSGRRRSLDVRDTAEIAFGSSAIVSGNTNSTNGSGGVFGDWPRYTQEEKARYLTKLRDDVQRATENTTLSSRERQLLEDARETLRRAVDDTNAGREVNSRDIRIALNDIRDVMRGSNFRREDRDRIQASLQSLRDLERDNARGARSRDRDR